MKAINAPVSLSKCLSKTRARRYRLSPQAGQTQRLGTCDVVTYIALPCLTNSQSRRQDRHTGTDMWRELMGQVQRGKRETDKQTDRHRQRKQADRLTQTKKIGRQTDRETNTQYELVVQVFSNKRANRHKDRETQTKKTERQIDKEKERQTNRQGDRKTQCELLYSATRGTTNRETDRQMDRQRD